MTDDALTRAIIGCAMTVHRVVGPGMLESVYQRCLAIELLMQGLDIDTQRRIPLVYRGEPVDAYFNLDFIVNDEVVVEIKAVEKMLPVHEAQVVTYLKLLNRRRGLLINFNVALLKYGVRRVTNRQFATTPED